MKLKVEDIKTVHDFTAFLKDGTPMGEVSKAVEKLLEIYGKKIIPGTAPDKELGDEEIYARAAYSSAITQLNQVAGVKKLNTAIEMLSVVEFKIKRTAPKVFKVIFFGLVVLAILKFLFS